MTDLTPRPCRSPHELERGRFSPRTLHEKMMLEAELVVRHNWTDVAVHDRDKLKSVPIGSCCYWVIGQMGSYLTPAYCELVHRERWSAGNHSDLAPIQFLVARWLDQAYIFRDCKEWKRLHDPYRDKRSYLVIKTDEVNGEIIPIDLEELMDMCVYKKFPTAVRVDT